MWYSFFQNGLNSSIYTVKLDSVSTPSCFIVQCKFISNNFGYEPTQGVLAGRLKFTSINARYIDSRWCKL